jgi:hypothetical protein
MPFPALRRRGSEDFSLLADAFSGEDVVHALDGSLLSWSFPPFEDDLPVSPVALLPGLLSWASIIDARSSIPLRFRASPHRRALFRVSEIRKYRHAHAHPPPWGLCLRYSAP